MLSARCRAAGTSLIELMVTIAIIGWLITLGVPTIGRWFADAHVRGAAEGLVNGLRLAQATAEARNRVSMLAFTNAAPATNAAVAAGGTNWFIGLVGMNGGTETSSSLGMVQSSTLATQYGVSVVAVGANVGLVCFNSLGQQATLSAAQAGLAVGCAPLAANAPTAFLVSAPSAVRKFKVLVYPAGQIFMCDALKTQSNANPDGCP